MKISIPNCTLFFTAIFNFMPVEGQGTGSQLPTSCPFLPLPLWAYLLQNIVKWLSYKTFLISPSFHQLKWESSFLPSLLPPHVDFQPPSTLRFTPPPPFPTHISGGSWSESELARVAGAKGGGGGGISGIPTKHRVHGASAEPEEEGPIPSHSIFQHLPRRLGVC